MRLISKVQSLYLRHQTLSQPQSLLSPLVEYEYLPPALSKNSICIDVPYVVELIQSVCPSAAPPGFDPSTITAHLPSLDVS